MWTPNISLSLDRMFRRNTTKTNQSAHTETTRKSLRVHEMKESEEMHELFLQMVKAELARALTQRGQSLTRAPQVHARDAVYLRDNSLRSRDTRIGAVRV